MDPSRVFSAMDAILTEGDLRAVRAPFLVHADIFARHASAAAHPGRGRRPGDFRGLGSQGLAALYPRGARLARDRAIDGLQDIPMSLHGLSRPGHIPALRYNLC